jgi:hypothetical protein
MDQLGCKASKVRYGTDGYGPWYDGAACIHDDFKLLPDKFEPANESDFERIQNRLKEAIEANSKHLRMIEKLEYSVQRLAKDTT